MTPPLTPRIRRLIAFALLAVVLSFAWFCVVQPVTNLLIDQQERRAIALRTLKRHRSLLATQPAIEASLATVKESPRWRNFYSDRTPDAASLQLQADLRSLLKDSHNPTSMFAESPVTQGPATRIAVRLTLSMRIDELAVALDRLQKQSKQLRVENLTIRAPDIQSAQSNPVLIVQAQISAWVATSGTGESRQL